MEVMLDKFLTKKTEAEVMKEAVTLLYDGGDITSFIAKADKFYSREPSFTHVRSLDLFVKL